MVTSILTSVPPIGWFFIFLSACVIGIVSWSCFYGWLHHREKVEQIKSRKQETPHVVP